MNNFLIIVVGLLIILIIVVYLQLRTVEKTVQINSKTITVEVADNPFKRSLGLMFRDSLPEDRGMLFVFGDEQPRSFWMLNTKIALEAIYIGSDGRIVDIITMEPCFSDPCKTYPSKEKAMYVLEVNRGFSARYNVAVGDKVII